MVTCVTCGQCGSPVGDGLPSCAACGTPVPAQAWRYGTAAGSAAQVPPGMPYGQPPRGSYPGAPAGIPPGQAAYPQAPAPSQYHQPAYDQAAFGQVPPRPCVPPPAAPGQPQAQASTGFRFDAGRVARKDRITGIASLVLLVTLILPWFRYTFYTNVYTGFDDDTVTTTRTASGLGSFFWLWLVALICVGVVALMVVEAGYPRSPLRLPMRRQQLLMLATGINVLLVVVCVLLGPATLFFAYVGLLAALAAAAAQVVPQVQARSNAGAAGRPPYG